MRENNHFLIFFYCSAQGDQQGFLQGPSIQIVVRRSHLYEDAFDKLRPENGKISFLRVRYYSSFTFIQLFQNTEPDLRARFRVQMINNIGLEEVSIQVYHVLNMYCVSRMTAVESKGRSIAD